MPKIALHASRRRNALRRVHHENDAEEMEMQMHVPVRNENAVKAKPTTKQTR